VRFPPRKRLWQQSLQTQICTDIRSSPGFNELISRIRIAKSECRGLTTEFHTRILREIRDWMYWYLVCPKESSIVVGYTLAPYGYEEVDPDFYGTSKDVQPNAYCMNPDFVGVEVVKEIAEVYYRNRFHLTRETHIPDHIEGDPFNIGVDPAKHLRHLTVLVNLTSNQSSHYEEVAQLRELLTNLLPLTLIKRKDRLQVEIRLTTAYHKRPLRGVRMLNLLGTIRIPIYFLLHHGAKVILLKYQGGRERYLTCYNDFGRLEDISTTDFFHLQSEVALKV
jgi:hypothetical protein